MTVRTSALALFLLSALVGCDTVVDEPAQSSAPVSEPWTEMLDAINAVRAEGVRCGGQMYPAVGPVVWNSRLELAALMHTLDMQENEHFAHVGTDGSEPGDRARRVGYRWRVVGENIARYQPTVDRVVRDWLESPGHCRQIMDASYVEMGAAERDRYWTQVFGVPR